MKLRDYGKIAKWNDERGFGFISSSKGVSVFVHISSFPRNRRPSLNEEVSYILVFDSQGRPQASDVEFILGSSRAQSMRQLARTGSAVPIAFASSFLIALAVLAAIEWLEWSLLALYYGASIVTYRCYKRDKTAAQNARRRTPESTLHWLSLVGGWPGALIAQVIFRHKTRKVAFLVGYWSTMTVNCVVLAVIVVKRVSPVKIFFAAAEQALEAVSP